ncbi:unnamed protein product [Ectocarpus sp. 4 AP-2014]
MPPMLSHGIFFSERRCARGGRIWGALRFERISSSPEKWSGGPVVTRCLRVGGVRKVFGGLCMHAPTIRCTHFPDARSLLDDFLVMFSEGAAAIAAVTPPPPVPLVGRGMEGCCGLHAEIPLCTLSCHGKMTTPPALTTGD